MLGFFALTFGIALSSGCNKENFDVPVHVISNPGEMLAPGGHTSDSPYKKLVAWDYFMGFGSSSQMDPTCYSDASKATCSRRLDWFAASSTGCSEDIAAMQKDNFENLDKCTWTLWDGFSFWEGSNNLAYKPSAVTVKNGILKIQSRVRPSSDGPFQCGAPTLKSTSANIPSDWKSMPTPPGGLPSKSALARDPLSNDYYDINCKVISGGVDSKDRYNGRTPGRNMRNGRLEIVARWTNLKGIWPALWMWRGDVGHGIPYIDTGHTTSPDYYGEIDIMESTPTGANKTSVFQTYHVWEKEHYTSGGTNVDLDFTQWNTYGVERTDGKIYFIVNGAYTKVVEDGGPDSRHRDTMRVDNIPEYLIMSLGLTKESAAGAWDVLNSATFEIKSVEFYERS